MSCYDNAVIYTIKVNEKLYVGSTNNFPKRENDHGRFMHTNAPNLYETIRANDYKYEIEIYKEYPCDDRTELRKEEQRCMNELGGLDCLLNTINAWTDWVEYRKEYREKNKDTIKIQKAEEYERNKEKYKASFAKYRATHKEEIAECNKKRYEENKEAILKQQKEYHEANKEDINMRRRKASKTPEAKAKKKEQDKKYGAVKIECECGSFYRRDNKAAHFRTQKHKSIMDELQTKKM